MLAALHVLTDPWADAVGRRALFEVVLLGVTGGALSCWIVFYNLSYSAESLAHALLPGLVIAASVLHGRLLAVGFDRLSAPSLGVRPFVVDAALLVLLALALLVAVQGLGNLLVVAVLVAPASAARLVARRMGPMMAASAAVAVVAGAGGLYLSYYAGTAAGASIAAILVGAYLVAGVGRGA